MTANVALVTGSSGLVGSETVAHFDAQGWTVHGVDNNMRRDFFGPDGDTSENLLRLRAVTRGFSHHVADIRDRQAMFDLIRAARPSLIVHCASQPSHDLARDRPFDDFEVNALATLNLLEAARQFCPESPFVFMSTNKVYGDAPNEKPLVERQLRWEYADPADQHGIDESSGSTARCTVSSAPPSWQPTCWSRNTAATLVCQPSACGPAASPARTTPGPSCMDSWPTWPAV